MIKSDQNLLTRWKFDVLLCSDLKSVIRFEMNDTRIRSKRVWDRLRLVRELHFSLSNKRLGFDGPQSLRFSIYLERIVEHAFSTGLYSSRSSHQIQQGTGSFRIYRRNALGFRSDKIPHGAGRIRLRLHLDSRNRLLKTSFSSCPNWKTMK